MDIPAVNLINNKLFLPALAAVAIILMAGAWFTFLMASWHSFQADRAMRDGKINELLDRLPRKTVPGTVVAE